MPCELMRMPLSPEQEELCTYGEGRARASRRSSHPPKSPRDRRSLDRLSHAYALVRRESPSEMIQEEMEALRAMFTNVRAKRCPAVSSKLQITPAECRLRAAECHKMAQHARRPQVRDTLAEIERMWNRLAVEAEVSESMLTRLLEDVAFGPDEIAIMVAAYELGLTQINASGHNDPTAEALAQTVVMLAKQGERDPVRLKQRAIEIMSGPPK